MVNNKEIIIKCHIILHNTILLIHILTRRLHFLIQTHFIVTQYI